MEEHSKRGAFLILGGEDVNISQCVDLVNEQLEEEYDDEEIIPLFNLCLMDLTPLRLSFGLEAFSMLGNRESETELEPYFRDMLIDFAIGQKQFTEEDYDERPDRMNKYLHRKEEYRRELARTSRASFE